MGEQKSRPRRGFWLHLRRLPVAWQVVDAAGPPGAQRAAAHEFSRRGRQ
jgi:hypothetical protein